MNIIEEKDWKWFGNAGHFICGKWCRFHLCTQVGDYLVSTVGEYVPPHKTAGTEQAERSYLKENPLGEDIGSGRKFETMAFKAGPPCVAADCGCGMPTPDDWSELEADCYNTRPAATEGHLAMCHKAARGEVGYDA